MSISYIKNVNVDCEGNTKDFFCWKSDNVYMRYTMSWKSGKKVLKERGWKLTGRILCPYCNKGVKK
jgi:hypothetical protein